MFIHSVYRNILCGFRKKEKNQDLDIFYQLGHNIQKQSMEFYQR